MANSRWRKYIVNDQTQKIVAGATVRVRKESDGLDATIYDRDGNGLSNPFTSDENGLAEFYAAGGLYRITITSSEYSADLRDEPVGEAQALDVGPEAGKLLRREDADGLYQSLVQDNLSGAGAPTVNDDAVAGYSVRSYWFDTSASPTEVYVCLDATVGAAIWELTTLGTEDLGSAATVNVGTGAGNISTNAQADTRHGKVTATIATLSALTGMADGDVVRVATTGRAGTFRFDSSDLSAEVTADTQKGIYVAPDSDVTGAGGAWVRTFSGAVDVRWFGAVFDNAAQKSANTSALQGAIDSGRPVYVPFEKSALYVTSNIQLNSASLVFGDSEWFGEALFANPSTGIIGDGTGPVFKTGVYPFVSHDQRSIELRYLRVENTGYPCVEFLSAPNVRLNQCLMRATDAECVRIRYSYRFTIRGGWYNAGFSVLSDDNFAITAYDNVNGLVITPDTVISGGTNGGGVDVSLSQNVWLDGIYEVCGTFGQRVCGFTGTGAGNCNGVRIGGYMEQVAKPFSIGAYNLALGVEWGKTYVGNTSAAAADYGILLGRVVGLKVAGGVSFHKKGTEPTIYFIKASPGGSITNYTIDSDIAGIYAQGGGDDYALDASVDTATQADIFARNVMRFGAGDASGVTKEYVSPVITADVGMASTNFAPAGQGGRILAVDIIEATGTLGCTLRVGYSGNISENIAVDPSTLTYSNGYSETVLSTDLMRPAFDQLLTVSAGAGTGTFRVRVRYRN